MRDRKGRLPRSRHRGLRGCGGSWPGAGEHAHLAPCQPIKRARHRRSDEAGRTRHQYPIARRETDAGEGVGGTGSVGAGAAGAGAEDVDGRRAIGVVRYWRRWRNRCGRRGQGGGGGFGRVRLAEIRQGLVMSSLWPPVTSACRFCRIVGTERGVGVGGAGVRWSFRSLVGRRRRGPPGRRRSTRHRADIDRFVLRESGRRLRGFSTNAPTSPADRRRGPWSGPPGWARTDRGRPSRRNAPGVMPKSLSWMRQAGRVATSTNPASPTVESLRETGRQRASRLLAVPLQHVVEAGWTGSLMLEKALCRPARIEARHQPLVGDRRRANQQKIQRAVGVDPKNARLTFSKGSGADRFVAGGLRRRRLGR